MSTRTSPQARMRARALLALHRRALSVGEVISLGRTEAGRPLRGLTLHEVLRNARRPDAMNRVLAYSRIETRRQREHRPAHLKIFHLTTDALQALVADALYPTGRQAPEPQWPFTTFDPAEFR